MKYMTHNEIRNTWIKFFQSKKHKLLESAPLVPIDDDSILWINAGVTPLKKYFDGSVVPENRRITNIQKCIRTNDIENVGITKRHQTFFEMMGNFSIGDYFKNEAIEFAFELLTSKEYFDIDKNLLYVTIYTNDEDAYKRWIEVGLDESHIVKLEGNFWEIGNGPCGPDSEIFFDRGEEYDNEDNTAFFKFSHDEEQERYVEIWNVVFSQFNSEEDKARKDYEELPSKNIDTGAGLERWCCIFQNVDSNFETDLFTPIIEHITELSNIKYNGQKEVKIIADHIRAITFALGDGAFFDNVGRGYVLRRLLRRSVRFGKEIGIECPFMYKIVSDVVNNMKDAYPELVEKRPSIETLVLNEENLFLKTLSQGERRLKELTKKYTDKIIPGEEAFKLYDTYGFPFELTEEYLNDLGYKTSKQEFDKYMAIQKQLAKESTKNATSMANQEKVLLDFKDKSEFVYNLYRLKSKIIAVLSHDKRSESLSKDGYIALDRTCFYAEAGGQVSDTGMIIGDNFKARVVNVIKGPNGQNIHKIRLLDGTINVGDKCELVIDKDRRKKIESNHSMVHILQYSLQQVVSNTIKQAGSYVDDKKLRFDFTYSGKMTDEKILKTEEFANNYVKQNHIVSTEILPIEKAKELGAMALFGEKYGEKVRVVKIGKSLEFCGGTHTSNTNTIKKFAITLCETKGSNIYRIEGTTNNEIQNSIIESTKPYRDEILKLLMKAKEILEKAKKEDIKLDFDTNIDEIEYISYKDIILSRNQLEYIQAEVKELEKKYFEIKEQNSLGKLDIYKEKEKVINNIHTIIVKVENKDNNILKSIIDNLINNKDNYFILFANVIDNKISYISRSTSKIDASKIIKEICSKTEGNGGGKPTFAQGGGTNIKVLDKVLEELESSLEDE